MRKYRELPMIAKVVVWLMIAVVVYIAIFFIQRGAGVEVEKAQAAGVTVTASPAYFWSYDYCMTGYGTTNGQRCWVKVTVTPVGGFWAEYQAEVTYTGVGASAAGTPRPGKATRCEEYNITSAGIKVADFGACKTWRWQNGQVLEATGLNVDLDTSFVGEALGWREEDVFFQNSWWLNNPFHHAHGASKAKELSHCLRGPLSISLFCKDYGVKGRIIGHRGGYAEKHIEVYDK
jgi:hypothetical protein